MKPHDLALSALRSRPATALARRFTGAKLRILAYHGVPDPVRFGAQMEYLAANFVPVSEQAVLAALQGGEELPSGAAWVTFDDGDPTVVRHGLPTLVRLGIPATMFVCAGLIDADLPFWWRVTERASSQDPALAASIAHSVELTEYVKTLEDLERRRIVDELLDLVAEPQPETWRQLSPEELTGWTDSGMALGNHSWDHPCLDRCSPEDQREQVQRTHEWLKSYLGHPPLSFAYPNGNFSGVVDSALTELGYGLAVLYDNQLTSLDSHPLRLSRLMLEADQPVERLVGVLSGAQPALARLADRFRAGG